MDRITDYLKLTGGFAHMKELRSAGFQTREVAALVAAGTIERVKPGLYRLADEAGSGEHAGLVAVCRAVPEGVICLISALDYHGLTTFNPSVVYVAIPHGAKPPRMHYPPIQPFFFRNRFYSPGIEQVTTPTGDIRIYNREKTVCDMFRYRHKLGEDLAREGLKEYLKQKNVSIPLLLEYAAVCQAKTVILPYLKALVA
jgi:predicted transcriptional regulator of viral defense system